jgi:hypothetical protein
MTMDVDFTYFLTYWREFVQCNLKKIPRKIPRNLSKVSGFSSLTKERGN